MKTTRGRRGAAGGVWLLLLRNIKGPAVSRVPAAFLHAEAGIRQERAQRVGELSEARDAEVAGSSAAMGTHHHRSLFVV